MKKNLSNKKKYSEKDFAKFFEILMLNFSLIIIPIGWIILKYSPIEGGILLTICIGLCYLINKTGGLI